MADVRRKQITILLSILITVFIISMALERPKHIEKFELAIDDIIYSLGIQKGKLDDIVIVAIDNQTVNAIGRWPWHRDRLAELISGIALRNPKVIGLDILLQRDFEEDTLGNTDRLASAIEAAGNVVVPSYFTLSKGGKIVDDSPPDFIYYNSFVLFDNPMTIGLYPIPRAIEVYSPAEQIGRASAAIGHVNLIPDSDGKIRWEPLVVSFNSHYFPSFAMQVARLYRNASPGGIKLVSGKGIQLGTQEIRTDAAMRIPISYSGGYNTFKYISASDIFEGDLPEDAFENKIVLVGYVAADNRDVVATPLTEVLPGVEKQASVVENLINGNILKGIKSSAWLNLLILILFGVLGPIILPRLALQYRVISIVGSLFLLFNIEYYMFVNYEIMLQFFYPAFELVLFLGISPLLANDRTGMGSKMRAAPLKDTMFGGRDLRGATQNMGNLEQTIVTSTADKIEYMGRYKIERVLGKGAMGTVYKGVDPAIGRPVAIKTIRIDRLDSDAEAAEMLKRLSQEAHSAGKLSHPNIIIIYDVGQERNLQYIAMEYLEGMTLEELLKQRKVLDFYKSALILKQTADALAYAHKQNVVHRDIKPANIMVLPDDTVKVMDFGIARADNMHMTQTGITVGTPNYISPEQLQGGDVDGRADIFSAGVVLYEAITGVKPFRGDNISSLVVNILNTVPAKPSQVNPEIPGELDIITMKALEKNREVRFQDAADFANDLRTFLGEKVQTSERNNLNDSAPNKVII